MIWWQIQTSQAEMVLPPSFYISKDNLQHQMLTDIENS
jgi:hypothetical protein